MSVNKTRKQQHKNNNRKQPLPPADRTNTVCFLSRWKLRRNFWHLALFLFCPARCLTGSVPESGSSSSDRPFSAEPDPSKWDPVRSLPSTTWFLSGNWWVSLSVPISWSLLYDGAAVKLVETTHRASCFQNKGTFRSVLFVCLAHSYCVCIKCSMAATKIYKKGEE